MDAHRSGYWPKRLSIFSSRLQNHQEDALASLLADVPGG
jgi:hypothetical protein